MNRLSALVYLSLTEEVSLSLTTTRIKSASIPGFGRINFWLGFLELTVKVWLIYVPSYTLILSKYANPVDKTGTVTSSGIAKV